MLNDYPTVLAVICPLFRSNNFLSSSVCFILDTNEAKLWVVTGNVLLIPCLHPHVTKASMASGAVGLRHLLGTFLFCTTSQPWNKGEGSSETTRLPNRGYITCPP